MTQELILVYAIITSILRKTDAVKSSGQIKGISPNFAF